MKKNIIIAVETLIIVILVVLLLSNRNSTETKETPKEDPNKNIIGIYHNAQAEQTIRLEENNICMYLVENKECSYSVENDIIKIHTTFYIIDAENRQAITRTEVYKSMQACKDALEKYKEEFSNLINPLCKEQEVAKLDYEARIVNNGNGLLVNNKVFNKIA